MNYIQLLQLSQPGECITFAKLPPCFWCLPVVWCLANVAIPVSYLLLVSAGSLVSGHAGILSVSGVLLAGHSGILSFLVSSCSFVSGQPGIRDTKTTPNASTVELVVGLEDKTICGTKSWGKL